ncbi:hypothetical protein [Geobacillus thermocatenulatus]|uniref:hypothetical protein n=1 Tax=Geobacillus thermocatenulatus TaxID=33938 RepID=UPI0012DCC66E|nr:hypothetical protein [Geobacillus thermocatenulatus]
MKKTAHFHEGVPKGSGHPFLSPYIGIKQSLRNNMLCFVKENDPFGSATFLVRESVKASLSALSGNKAMRPAAAVFSLPSLKYNKFFAN